MEPIIQSIRQELAAASQIKENLKDGNNLITSVVRSLSRKVFKQVKHLNKREIFNLCEQLLESGDWPERTIAFDWAFRCEKLYEASDFTRFETWLASYVHNWGSCDNFCTHAFGSLILQYPECIPEIMK